MISKNKQDYEIEMHFDPKLVELRRSKPFKQTDHFVRDISFRVRNSTMDWNEICSCEFLPIKNFEEHTKKVKKLRKFAAGLKNNPCFDPISVVVQDGDKLYSGIIAMPDSSKKKLKVKNVK